MSFPNELCSIHFFHPVSWPGALLMPLLLPVPTELSRDHSAQFRKHCLVQRLKVRTDNLKPSNFDLTKYCILAGHSFQLHFFMHIVSRNQGWGIKSEVHEVVIPNVALGNGIT